MNYGLVEVKWRSPCGIYAVCHPKILFRKKTFIFSRLEPSNCFRKATVSTSRVYHYNCLSMVIVKCWSSIGKHKRHPGFRIESGSDLDRMISTRSHKHIGNTAKSSTQAIRPLTTPLHPYSTPARPDACITRINQCVLQRKSMQIFIHPFVRSSIRYHCTSVPIDGIIISADCWLNVDLGFEKHLAGRFNINAIPREIYRLCSDTDPRLHRIVGAYWRGHPWSKYRCSGSC